MISKRVPDTLAMLKDHSVSGDAVDEANRTADTTERTRVNSMSLEGVLTDLRANMAKGGTDSFQSLSVERGLLTIVQRSHGDSATSPQYDVTQIPLAALDVDGIHVSPSSSGVSVIFQARPGTPDALMTNTSGFYVRHNVSNSIEFSDAAIASLAALEFSRLVQLSNGIGSTNWLEIATSEWKRASDPETLMRSAYYDLGMKSLNSEIGSHNSLLARAYFEQAAENGDSRSASQLAQIYEKGIGVQRDLNGAMKWYVTAKTCGSETAERDIARVQNEIDQQQLAQREAAQEKDAQILQAAASTADLDRQSKISQLRSDIESQNQLAENDENSANQVLNNCSGPGAALCQALGQAGAARLRQKAAEARNQADSDREEIERLQGEEVQAHQRRDTSYGGNLQQVATETGTNIQNAAAQQQASLRATAAAIQQRQQGDAQARLASQNSQPVPVILSNS